MGLTERWITWHQALWFRYYLNLLEDLPKPTHTYWRIFETK